MQDQEAIREFLIESNENLDRLGRELVELEKRPEDEKLIASVFRTIHTIKGTSGFFGFEILGSITHIAENILTQIRDKQRPLTPELVSLTLETVDAVQAVLANIESSGQEGEDTYQALRQKLDEAYLAKPAAPVAPVKTKPPEKKPAPATQEAAQVHASTPAAVPAEKPATVATSTVAPKAEIEPSKKEAEATAKGPGVADSTIRVDVVLLDKLMNLVGELVLARNQILQVDASQDSAFTATSQRLNLITTELQEGVMKTRMQPIGLVWDKLPRVVRDLASSCGKKIHIEMEGADTELDKTIIEAIKDPLTHIVRNACDHGIELPEARTKAGKNPQGKLSLRAYHEGGHVIIEIADDGAGINLEKLKQKAIKTGLIRPEQAKDMGERETLSLIFMPGFSTAATVTSISGRGVGMDVVKTNIEKIGGVVDMHSTLGQGSTVRMKIPLTLAIIPALIVSSGGDRYAIPQVSLLELVRLEGEQVHKEIELVHGAPVHRLRGRLLPLVYLNRELGLDGTNSNTGIPTEAESVNIVVLQADDRQFGLVVDDINDTEEIVVKPLGKQLKSINLYAGATIMGDGQVALILDVMGLAQCANLVGEIHDRALTATEQKAQAVAAAARSERKALLLFRNGEQERMAIDLSLVSRLEEIARESVEHSGGQEVVQYRGQIMPIIRIAEILGSDSVGPQPTGEGSLQVVVYSDNGRNIGLHIDQIVDIVEESFMLQPQTARKGVLGSAVIQQRTTDVLDVPAIVAAWQSRGKSLAAHA